MIRFEISVPVPRPPGSCREAWLEFHRTELDRSGSTGLRRVEPLTPARFRVETTGKTRRGSVRTHGVITFDEGTAWSVRTETEVDGRPYAREWARYELRESQGSREVSAAFELVGVSTVVDFALNEGRELLKSERERALSEFAASLRSRTTR